MTQIYRYELTVSPDTIDENGHVNNVEYLRWMLDAAVSHSTSQGSTRAVKELGMTWVVRTHRIEYLRPAFAGDKITVLTWVSNFRRVLSLRKYKVLRVSDNAVLAEGETQWVFVEAKTGKLRSIPKSVSSTFEILPSENEKNII
ncbi:MAG TPA: acyl-CoA thioesterase [Deltaproteobacteria bacterium]|nr:acyl-CoA thioesterase [Deltaproteobacteria bacterium]